MTLRSIPKPQKGEYAPYAIMYIDLLPDDGQVLQHMHHNFKRMEELIRPLAEEKLITPWGQGEWTIKEILSHIVDDERIYVYRALRFARNDMTELPGFNQDDYVVYSGANERSLADIIEEYRAVRLATITLFNHLPDAALLRVGVANDHLMSVRAAAYHIAGHELHHLHSIQANYQS